MGLGTDLLILFIVGAIIWVIVPDPIPFIDDIILIPIIAVALAKLGGDM